MGDRFWGPPPPHCVGSDSRFRLSKCGSPTPASTRLASQKYPKSSTQNPAATWRKAEDALLGQSMGQHDGQRLSRDPSSYEQPTWFVPLLSTLKGT